MQLFSDGLGCVRTQKLSALHLDKSSNTKYVKTLALFFQFPAAHYESTTMYTKSKIEGPLRVSAALELAASVASALVSRVLDKEIPIVMG